MNKTITVERVNIPLLRKQRNLLLELREKMKYNSKNYLLISGNIHLLDTMLDIAEGFYHG
tara:strand:- start:213 stop:392 length:180 start_codon:yes stop_codon:yes gene_type:complete